MTEKLTAVEEIALIVEREVTEARYSELLHLSQEMDTVAFTSPPDRTWEECYKLVRRRLSSRMGSLPLD